MADERTEQRLTALESKYQELELMVNTALRLLAGSKPLSHLLERFGATEGAEAAVYKVLDDMVQRIDGDERDRPTLAEFRITLSRLMPDQGDGREFGELVLETLRMERPAYHRLHDFLRGERT